MSEKKFLTVMAVFDTETQLLLSSVQNYLIDNISLGTQTMGIPFHLTLGSFPVDDLEQVTEAIKRVTTASKPFDIYLTGYNNFGHKVFFIEPEITDELIVLRKSFERDYANGLDEKAKLLLSRKPYAPVMMTVTPETLELYAESVKYLYGLGFRYLICSMDYIAPWREEHLPLLKRQYRTLASFYREKSRKEEKFYLSPFETKIASHIRSHDLRAERCELGKKQLSIAPDGKIYPCVQLMEEEYCIGDIESGIDEGKRQTLYLLNEREKDECIDCAIRDRCAHHCACVNKCATGSITRLSPFQCAHERIVLPIADSLAERLYQEKNALFLQKQYNDMFPLLSLAEDRTR